MAQLTNISKSMIFATFVCVVLALDFDDKENTAEYDVPQHGRVEHLVHFHSGYKIMKNLQRKECYVLDVPNNEPKTIQVKLALQKMNGTFPNNYFVERNNIFPLYKMEISQLSQSILKFCGGYQIMKSISVKSARKAEQVAVKMFRKKQRQRRTVTFPEFIACSVPNSHPCRDPESYIFKCKIMAKCTPTLSGWHCEGTHFMQSGVICCDIRCK